MVKSLPAFPRHLLTWMVVGVIYLSWLGLTWFHASLPAPLLFVLGGFIVCWHGSLQHETIHGHPTRKRWLNALLGYPPIGLAYPYVIYRDTHLEHHAIDHLTHPEQDPESYYVFKTTWEELNPVARWVLRLNHTAVGRLFLGPVLVPAVFYFGHFRDLLKGERKYLKVWLLHFALVGLVMAWVLFACKMSVGRYLLCFVYPGISLTLLRAYLEHRPASCQDHRTAVVEGGLFSLLYLGVNYHYLHHKEPWLPWYELGPRYHQDREELLEANGGYHFENYAQVLRNYAFTPKDSPVFPDPLQ